MTALAANRPNTAQAIGDVRQYPIAAATIIYAGALVAIDASGNLVPASASATLRVVGRAEKYKDNSAGAAAALSVDVKTGIFSFGQSGTTITKAHINQMAYVVDDQTVSLSDNGGARPAAGRIDYVDTANGVFVAIGQPILSASASTGSSGVHQARYMATANIANLAAFTVLQDGVTGIAGERVFLPFQTSGAENGIYELGTVAAGAAPLTRVADFNATGAGEVEDGALVKVAEGTVGADRLFMLRSNNPIVVGTTALAFQEIPAGPSPTAVGQIPRATVVGSATVPGEVQYGQLDLANSAAVTGVLRSNNETPHTVRYVMTTNVANLSTFTVAQDGVTGVAGDHVLLANQTAGAECGVYVLGTVGGGTCALTRAPWLPAAAVVQSGYTVHVGEGTLNAASNWFISTAGAITIGTTAHLWFPEEITQKLSLVAGATTITNVPILSATKVRVSAIRSTANTCAATDGGYVLNGDPTAGVVGTASCAFMASVLAGTLNNADISTLHITIANR